MKFHRRLLRRITHRRIRIQVTQEDINTGVPVDALQCPVARAVQRAMGHQWRAGVTRAVNPFTGYVSSPYPRPVWAWVRRFDHNQQVEPITFHLYVRRSYL